MTKKTYENPFLQVYAIRKSDVIATSPTGDFGEGDADPLTAPGRLGLDDEDAEN